MAERNYPLFCVESGCPRRAVRHDANTDRWIYGDLFRCAYHQPRAIRPGGCGIVLIRWGGIEVRCRGGANLCRNCSREAIPQINTIGLPDDPPRDRLWLIRREANT